jgi:hypothetical protein
MAFNQIEMYVVMDKHAPWDKHPHGTSTTQKSMTKYTIIFTNKYPPLINLDHEVKGWVVGICMDHNSHLVRFKSQFLNNRQISANAKCTYN